MLDGWRWREKQEKRRSWESAYLSRVKQLPELDEWVDPPRPKKLTPEQVEAEKRSMHDLASKLPPPKRKS